MKPVAFESGALPAHDAREALRDLLQPGMTVYLILRHVSRSKAQGEVSLLQFGEWFRNGRYIVHGPPVLNLSRYVADAFHEQLGPQGGVLVRHPEAEYGPWLIQRLNELCGFTTPETALTYHWL